MAYNLTNRHLSQDAYTVSGDDRPSKRVELVTSTGLATSDNPIPVRETGRADDNNSTNTPLAASATYTGTATDVSAYSAITVLVSADVVGSIVVQFSQDASDWHDGETYLIPAGGTKFFTPPVQAKFFRIVYNNGGTDQTDFHIHTMLKPDAVKWSSHNLNDNLNDQDDAELNVSVLKLRTAANNYVSGAATNSGNFKVSLEEFEPGAILPTSVYSINNVDDDGNDANANYYGFEKADGGWYIMKEDKSTNPIVYTYSTGASDYATAWTNRASQSYDTFGNTF